MANRPELDPGRLSKTRQRMCAAVLDCVAEGFEELEPAITLRDPADRHASLEGSGRRFLPVMAMWRVRRSRTASAG